MAYLASPRYLETLVKTKFNKAVGRLRSGMRKVFKKSLTTSLGEDPHNIEGFFREFKLRLKDLVGTSSGDIGEVLVSHSIRIIDSGGQPQFHDLLSIFIPELSGLVSVFKLSEPLAVRGEVVFFKNGKQTCAPYESHYTNEQVIRHDLQVVQSEAMRRGIQHVPNLAFVGTHLDAYTPQTCPESPDQKDERLHSIVTEMLPQEMEQSVISAGAYLGNLTFHIKDFENVEELKKLLLSLSRVNSRDLPLGTK